MVIVLGNKNLFFVKISIKFYLENVVVEYFAINHLKILNTFLLLRKSPNDPQQPSCDLQENQKKNLFSNKQKCRRVRPKIYSSPLGPTGILD
jgi:hypothetical protein